MMRLTEHFRERWRERVGGSPPPGVDLARWIREESVQIQADQLFKTDQGFVYRVLATYWLPERELVVKVDERTAPARAVTVLTRGCRG